MMEMILMLKVMMITVMGLYGRDQNQQHIGRSAIFLVASESQGDAVRFEKDTLLTNFNTMKAIAFPIKFDFNLWAQMQKYAGKGESACHIMYLVFLSVLLHVSHCVCHWFSLCVYPCHWLV